MKLSIYMVTSIDGIAAISSDEDIHAYSSPEDRDFFLKSLRQHDAVITGRTSARHKVSLPRFVLTSNAESQPPVQGTTYLGGDVKEICETVRKQGYENVALLGGPSTNFAFLRENLVDEIFLTIEPVMLGKGIPLSVGGKLCARWKLLETRRLNEKGTLLLHYARD